MAKAWAICSRCPTPVAKPGMCANCRAKTDKVRRPDGNPYSTPGHLAFREAVLARNPICMICLRARSTVADHHPHERRDLITMGLDPNDPQHGRGLCKPCHDKHTAGTSPGGWAANN